MKFDPMCSRSRRERGLSYETPCRKCGQGVCQAQREEEEVSRTYPQESSSMPIFTPDPDPTPDFTPDSTPSYDPDPTPNFSGGGGGDFGGGGSDGSWE